MVNFEETFISQPVYIIFYSVANFFLPLVILLTLYTFICKTIWESARYTSPLYPSGRVPGTPHLSGRVPGSPHLSLSIWESARYILPL